MTVEKNFELTQRVSLLETSALISKNQNAELLQRMAILECNVLANKDAQNEELMTLKPANLAPCTFKLNNYQMYKRENKQFFSPPFCSSYSGYKMCLRADANGDGSAAGTHVSVFACLMKGDHDDTLTWPFTGSVTFELLNQLEDKHHEKMSISFPADGKASQRVVDDKRGGYGRSKFISHAALAYVILDYNARVKTQYLTEDTLVFRVSVKIPNQKPWLLSTM